MYAKLADKLSVTTALSPDFSPAVSMAGANAFRVELTIFAVVAAATLTVEVQGSNDLQNWGTALAAVAGLTVGYNSPATFQGTAIAFAYVRLKYTSVGAGGAVILASGINTTSL